TPNPIATVPASAAFVRSFRIARLQPALLFIVQADAALAFAMIAEVDAEIVMLVIIVAAEMD
ncbi:MAG: hypothetical protein WB820_14625, partial [Rhodoplanes sp.]